MNIWFVKPERWSGQMAAHAGARRAPSRSQLVAACFVLLAMAAASSAFVLDPPLPALAGQGAAQNRPQVRLRPRGGHRSVQAMAGFGTGFGSQKKVQGKKKASRRCWRGCTRLHILKSPLLVALYSNVLGY